MRISDWSSDVCSSDLQNLTLPLRWGRARVGVTPVQAAIRPHQRVRLLSPSQHHLAAPGIAWPRATLAKFKPDTRWLDPSIQGPTARAAEKWTLGSSPATFTDLCRHSDFHPGQATARPEGTAW